MDTSPDTTTLAHFSAPDIIACLGYPSPHRDLVEVNEINDNALMIVGYRACRGSRKIASGRVAWVRCNAGVWHHERRLMSDRGEIDDPLQSKPSAWILTTMADVHAVIVWATGAA